VIIIYACIISFWSRIVIGDTNITTIDALFKKTNVTPYSCLNKVFIDDWLGIRFFKIQYNNNGKEGLVTVNKYSNAKDILRRIYRKVDKSIYDDEVKIKLGLN
jgi:hypothetical protein